MGTFFFYTPTINAGLKIKCVPFDSKYFSKKEGFFISNTVYRYQCVL